MDGQLNQYHHSHQYTLKSIITSSIPKWKTRQFIISFLSIYWTSLFKSL